MAEIVQTQSTTPLDRVTVVSDPSGMVTHVWLRTNILTEAKENSTSEDSDAPVSYTADELYIVLPGVCSVESIENRFDILWNQYGDTRTVEDRLTELEEVVSSVAAASMNLTE